MKKTFATILSMGCLSAAGEKAQDVVQDEISAPTLEKNAAYLQRR